MFIKEDAKETGKEGTGLGLHVLGLLGLRAQESSLFEALKKDIVTSFVLSCTEMWLVNRAILPQFRRPSSHRDARQRSTLIKDSGVSHKCLVTAE